MPTKEEQIKQCDAEKRSIQDAGLIFSGAATVFTATSGGLGKGGLVIGSVALAATEMFANHKHEQCLKKANSSFDSSKSFKW